MKKKSLFTVLSLVSALFLFNACKKDKDKVNDPDEDENESEIITTLKLNFSPVGGGTSYAYQYRDADGDGGNAPVIDTIKLDPNKEYNVTAEFWDETKSPAVNLTTEISEEMDDHMMGFTHSGANITTVIQDKDSKNLPIGLLSKWTTTSTSSGTSTVVLKHQPGIKDGIIYKGETDVEVVFPSKVK